VHFEADTPQAAAVVGLAQVWSGAQQPVGQDAELHTHLPSTHR